ncbi:MAG TPA: hypothetical protein VII12_00800 [Thermoanaerobaculia bacterium]
MIALAAIVLSGAVTLRPCCKVVGLNTRIGVALAQNEANETTFLFTAKNKSLISSLRPGTPVSFSRKSGLSVAGHPAGAFRLIRWPKNPPGGGRPVHVEVDCSKTPEFCRGFKPGQNKIDYIGGTTDQDVQDYCDDNPNNCIFSPW